MAYQQNGDLTSKTGNFTMNNGDFFEWWSMVSNEMILKIY